ncbi:MAG: DUF448 domain-containing protein [bacterium]|nr:MAG: DUF448 domain-containing protein [bacterium]
MSQRTEPVRTCTGCGTRKGKREMIRIVKDPHGPVTPDLKGRLPARGAYACFVRGCIESAARGRLAGALRVTPDVVDGDALAVAVGEALRRRVLSLLGVAQKGGMVTSGTNLVEGELRRGAGDGWIALIAEDASLDIAAGIRKRMQACKINAPAFLTKDELGNAVGKSPRSVLLVKDLGLGEAIMEAINRYRAVMDKGGKAA